MSQRSWSGRTAKADPSLIPDYFEGFGKAMQNNPLLEPAVPQEYVSRAAYEMATRKAERLQRMLDDKSREAALALATQQGGTANEVVARAGVYAAYLTGQGEE